MKRKSFYQKDTKFYIEVSYGEDKSLRFYVDCFNGEKSIIELEKLRALITEALDYAKKSKIITYI